VAIGACVSDALVAARTVGSAGYTVRVVDPRWVQPVDPALTELARRARLVVTVEDGLAAGGAGARTGQAIAEAGVDVPARHIGVPREFPEHGTVSDVRAWAGLTAAGIGRRIVEWAALVDHAAQPVSTTATNGRRQGPCASSS
ncbi:MAG: 1-deoxy-D-xylulose-5-phosphate synthase, partial [Jatrophihabitans sp.]